MSRSSRPLAVTRLLLLVPIAALPWLAALVLQGREPAAGISGLERHWFWLLVALGLGVWAGWHEAGAPDQPPEDAAL
jgi:hypothetical protein